jgi:hypothetical protein
MREKESTSFEASTMFTTGVPPAPLGKRGFETKARNLSLLGPLLVLVLVLEELELPQETMLTPTAISTKMLTKTLFKPGTPKRMRDRDLDARKRIITERLGRILADARAVAARDAKATLLLYSEENGY